jgi:hypothetical protein
MLVPVMLIPGTTPAAEVNVSVPTPVAVAADVVNAAEPVTVPAIKVPPAGSVGAYTQVPLSTFNMPVDPPASVRRPEILFNAVLVPPSTSDFGPEAVAATGEVNSSAVEPP